MAKLLVDGVYLKAKAHCIPSSRPAYKFQHLYHHLTKTREYMAWRGEYPDGHFTDYISIPKSEFEHWKRRIKAEETKPEAQLMSEYSERAGRPADIALYYHKTIEAVQRYCTPRKV